MKFTLAGYDYTLKQYFEHMGFDHVPYMKDADFLVICGGVDIDPYFYGGSKQMSRKVWYPRHNRDFVDFTHIKQAYDSKKKIIGICRGLQSINVASGGLMIDDINDHQAYGMLHPIKLLDGSEMKVNSRHHQMVYPFNLPRDHYSIIGWSEGLSTNLDGDPYYLVQKDLGEISIPTVKKHFCMPGSIETRKKKPNVIMVPKEMEGSIFDSQEKMEPEIVLYHKLSALGFQYHPESFYDNKEMDETSTITETFIRAFLDNRL